jgi:hypothetical protein
MRLLLKALLLLAFPASIHVSNFDRKTAPQWGFFAHKRINRLATLTLPPEMMVFFKPHIDFLTDHAVDPDMRRYASRSEGPRHFIDLDQYGPPFDSLPHSWKAATARYPETQLTEHGILPWNLQKVQSALTTAFRRRESARILRLCADIGHYIGDAHVPLHTTSNYNGQKTGQQGIHGFWESRIPELFADASYDYFVGKPEYIPRTEYFFWSAVFDSHTMVDSVLVFERDLRARFPADLQVCPEIRNNGVVLAPCREFSDAYQSALQQMIERRMRAAIHAVANAWYTAWVDAGQPDLSNMDPVLPTAQELQEAEALKKAFNLGKILGRPE